MFEPAASSSFFILFITRRTCSAKGGFGKGGLGRPCSRASRTALENASSNGGRPETKIRSPWRTHRLNGAFVIGRPASYFRFSWGFGIAFLPLGRIVRRHAAVRNAHRAR